MRKLGELKDRLLEDSGVSAESINNCRFIKTAMIERVMHNLNVYAARDGRTPVITDDSYERILNKTAENVAISDILGIADTGKKVDLILQKIGEVIYEENRTNQ
ncbi:MAG: hypothetical protein WC279_12815 [Sulfurimonas sp.]|jgi:hypothetical protein|uniref:hypothetical protein n=1 Tax=Sulfurimonas sp. TaxID=2022749 RepID=UPI0035659D86